MTDTGPDLAASLALANPGDTLVLGPGRHEITAPLQIASNISILGAGSGENPAVNTILDAGALTSGIGLQIQADGADGHPLTLSNLRILGPSGTSLYALSLQGDYLALENVIIDNSGYGIQLGHAQHLSFRDCTFRNCTTGIARAGTAMEIGDFLFEDCLFEESGYGVQIYQNDSAPLPFDSVTFRRCTFRNLATKGLYFERLSNALVEDCLFQDAGADGAWACAVDVNLKHRLDYANLVFRNNIFDHCGHGDATNGSAIAVKARNDSSYEALPAALDTVLFESNVLRNLACPSAFFIGTVATGANEANITGVSIAGMVFEDCATASPYLVLDSRYPNPADAVDAREIYWDQNIFPRAERIDVATGLPAEALQDPVTGKQGREDGKGLASLADGSVRFDVPARRGVVVAED